MLSSNTNYCQLLLFQSVGFMCVEAHYYPEFTVSRRYRDFLWLYNSLHGSNPGVVVAPPPEKTVSFFFSSL
jgi:hypothetical protein